MKKQFIILGLLLSFSLISCEDGIRDITGGGTTPTPQPTPTTEVVPVDINTDGFDFLEKIQGQWVGINKIIADEYPWFAFDFRAISSSQIHSMHEAGTQGNLFNTFFVTNYKGKRTIMGRNGGVLNNLYRTSYFVLDSISTIATNEKYYRFVDAVGGKNTMKFELRFKQDSLFFNAYTSNLGLRNLPTRHMTFKGKKNIIDLAQNAATATNFPQNSIDSGLDFASGLNENNLYIPPGKNSPTTGTFLAQEAGANIFDLAILSGDPYTISQYPRVGSLQVNFTRNININNTDLLMYLTKEPLTDVNGILTSNIDAYNTILSFPVIDKTDTATSFDFKYLHPGNYYLTIVSDKNTDYSPGEGDIVSPSKMITIAPLEDKIESVTNIDVQN